MMPGYLVMDGLGLCVQVADVAPVNASDREIAGEPRGVMRIVCGWTQSPLGLVPCPPDQHGLVPCPPDQHGLVSHGISPRAAAGLRAEIAKLSST